MSSILLHNNSSIFPDPFSFNPDRWLGKSGANLSKYLVPFSRGSRQCVGMKYVSHLINQSALEIHRLTTASGSLAYCEMYLTLAAVLAPGRFEIELFETTRYDVKIEHDFFTPCFPTDSKGIRVLVK